MADWRPVALPLVLGAVVLYAFLWRAGPEHRPDTPSYLVVAADLADWRLDALHLRTPGYPLLLRLLGGDRPGYSLVLVQLALHAVGVWSLAGLLARLGIGRWGLVAFVLACWTPHVVQLANSVLSETLAAALLMLGFAGLARAVAFDDDGVWPLIGASAAFGWLALTRPVYLATAPALAAVLALVAMTPLGRAARRRWLRAAAIVPLGTLLLAGGLALYQQARFGAPASSQAAQALAGRAARYIEALPAEEPLREILLRHRNATLVAGRHHRFYDLYSAWPEIVDHFDGDERRASRELLRVSFEVVRREPRNYLLAVWRSFAEYWEWYSRAVPGLQALGAAATFFAIHCATVMAFFSLLGASVVAGTLLPTLPRRVRRRSSEGVAEPAALSVYLLATSVVLFHMALQCALGVGEARYRLPNDPLVLTAIAAAASILARLHRRIAAGSTVSPD